MRVCLYGTYDPAYVRNVVLHNALQGQGIEVLTCRTDCWPSHEMRLHAVQRGRGRVRHIWQWLRAQGRLVRQHARLVPYDALLVCYPGHLDMFLARLLAWGRRRPLIFDAFLSLYETVVEDRRLVSPHALFARFLWAIDWLALHLADHILIDTQTDAEYLAHTFGIPLERITAVWVGADDKVYQPQVPSPLPKDGLRVIYFGQFIPLHGVETILQAAALLKGRPIHFELIGSGQTYAAMRALAEELGLNNITWGPRWLEPAALAERIAQADVCLGIFGASEKARRVIPTKAFIALAMEKALVTMDSPAAREVFAHREDAYLCEQASPQSLAEALTALCDDPALLRRLQQNGRALYARRFSQEAIGQILRSCLESLIEAPTRRSLR